jgi:L-ascorbate metabolism protein UlaG (beta-lactamase superfamily)
MIARLAETAFSEPLSEILAEPPGDGLRLYWLGQAGFVVEAAGRRIVIDPYLSDSLAEKYRGTPRPHVRMMPPPVSIERIGAIDLVICTHAHTDHMDPGTLKLLLRLNPNAALLAPRAVRVKALDRSGIEESRLLLINNGETIEFGSGFVIIATRSAHEALEMDQAGQYPFLGYLFDFGGLRLWHSGDCVPFLGLEDELRTLRPNIALLPVNGRRADLARSGVSGNFSLNEAIKLGRAIGVSDLVAHHYGMFDFNTADPDAIDLAAKTTGDLHVHRARTGIAFTWTTL